MTDAVPGHDEATVEQAPGYAMVEPHRGGIVVLRDNGALAIFGSKAEAHAMAHRRGDGCFVVPVYVRYQNVNEPVPRDTGARYAYAAERWDELTRAYTREEFDRIDWNTVETADRHEVLRLVHTIRHVRALIDPAMAQLDGMTMQLAELAADSEARTAELARLTMIAETYLALPTVEQIVAFIYDLMDTGKYDELLSVTVWDADADMGTMRDIVSARLIRFLKGMTREVR